MSDNNNGVMIAGLIVGYLYLKRRQAGAVIVTSKAPPLPASMPGSVGAGNRQIAVGAIQGLLRGLAAAPANNTSQTFFPSAQLPDSYGIAQESVDYTAPGAELIDNGDYGWIA